VLFAALGIATTEKNKRITQMKLKKKLKENRKRGDIVIEPNNFPGPAILIRKIKKSSQEEMINCGSDLIIKFSKKIPENPILSFL